MQSTARIQQQDLTLQPRQSRLIDARAGLRLDVLSGCLWLTRPHDSVDRFLRAGASIELHDDQILIQSEALPGSAPVRAASYTLLPIRD